jgi:hypothetical protein
MIKGCKVQGFDGVSEFKLKRYYSEVTIVAYSIKVSDLPRRERLEMISISSYGLQFGWGCGYISTFKHDRDRNRLIIDGVDGV